MVKKKRIKSKKKYLVLVAITNRKTGITFQPGSHIHAEDFPPEIIENWLSIDPPVLVPSEGHETVAFVGELKATENDPDGKEVSDGKSGQE